MIYYHTASDIRRIFLVDPSELQDGSTVDEVYARKLKESKKIGTGAHLVGRNYGYGQNSLFYSIRTYWIQEPIVVHIQDRLIYDGLHRIACAYNIDKDKLIPVVYI